MASNNQQYKIDKKLLELLHMEDILYNNITLRKVLSTKLKVVTKLSDIYFLLPELKVYLNEETSMMRMDKLITLIKTSYSDNIAYPNCHYYHYNEKANYDNI